MDYNDDQCEGLHELVAYSIHGFELTKGALDLEKWFKEVFSAANPTAALDFNFGRATDPETGDPALEIMSHNPDVFGLMALVTMYHSYKHDLADKKSKKSKRLQVANKLDS